MKYGIGISKLRRLAVLMLGALAMAACSQSGETEGGLAADLETATAGDAARPNEPTAISVGATSNSTTPPPAGVQQTSTTSETESTTGDEPAGDATSTSSSGTTTTTAPTPATATKPTTTTPQTTISLQITSSQTTSLPTTREPTTTIAATTTQPTSNTSGGRRFETLPLGATLPSGANCASRVRAAPETRSGNAGFNATRGSGSNDRYPRVDGNFVGTTDEIIQWAACKWGIDEDIARAQAAKESWWDMTIGGDKTSNQESCHPELRNDGAQCPESVGLLQVRYLYHLEAFESSNSIRSTAYNLDYAYAVWRECFDGGFGWLNTVEKGREYTAGDLDGCLGMWFSGRWYTSDALPYIAEVKRLKQTRVWEQPDFLNY